LHVAEKNPIIPPTYILAVILERLLVAMGRSMNLKMLNGTLHRHFDF
jgi:hypothetical protein